MRRWRCCEWTPKRVGASWQSAKSNPEDTRAEEDEENTHSSSNDEGQSPSHAGSKGGSAASTTGRWTKAEHEAFLVGLKLYGREWKKVATKIKTRTSAQIRSHAQKYFAKVAKERALEDNDEHRGRGDVWLLEAVETTLAALRERRQALLDKESGGGDRGGGGFGDGGGDGGGGGGGGGETAVTAAAAVTSAFTPMTFTPSLSDTRENQRHERRSSSPPMSIDTLEDNELVALQVLCSNSAGRRDALSVGSDRKAMTSPVVRLGGDGELGDSGGRKRPYVPSALHLAEASSPAASTEAASADAASTEAEAAADSASAVADAHAPEGAPGPSVATTDEATDGGANSSMKADEPALKKQRFSPAGSPSSSSSSSSGTAAAESMPPPPPPPPPPALPLEIQVSAPALKAHPEGTIALVMSESLDATAVNLAMAEAVAAAQSSASST